MSVLLVVFGAEVGVGEPADEKLARVGDIVLIISLHLTGPAWPGTHIDVRMHGMLAEEIDSKLFPSLGKSHQTIQGDDIGKRPTALIEMCHPQEP